ncbi:DUF6999 family protein [Leptodesmis sp.]|uniref:DUF6999 family protein n=1 Tax=Leptodesmis sp. TaxID=3100501 RepID=UPI00405354F2
MYSFWLTCEEFERAVLSPKFDENFGCYISTVTGDRGKNYFYVGIKSLEQHI